MVQIFVTGGTFDKEYNLINGELYFKDTHLMEMFERGRCNVEIDIKTLMMVDSLEMGEAERTIIAYNCEKSASDNILITHGTDTMVETAKYLAARNLPNDCTDRCHDSVCVRNVIRWVLQLRKCFGICTNAATRRFCSDEWQIF